MSPSLPELTRKPGLQEPASLQGFEQEQEQEQELSPWAPCGSPKPNYL
jgi:hypothetical protein